MYLPSTADVVAARHQQLLRDAAHSRSVAIARHAEPAPRRAPWRLRVTAVLARRPSVGRRDLDRPTGATPPTHPKPRPAVQPVGMSCEPW
jgi:hypothetical protein